MKNTVFKLIISLFLIVIRSYGQAPIADFSANVVSGCAPLVVKFTDLSTNAPSSWKWDLGNNAISSVQNPVTTFVNPGTYTITLKSGNAGGTNTVSKSAFIIVYAVPIVDFASADTAGCAPVISPFTDRSTTASGSITQWEWNFGDGATAVTQNPSHTYTSAGRFGVFLKATNSFGCSSIASKSQYVKVSGQVKANFVNATPSVCSLPVSTQFSNTSSGTGSIKYLWSFGDGNTSSVVNPVHAYKSFGDQVVKLVVANEAGCSDSITKAINLPEKTAVYQGPATLCVASVGSFSVSASASPISVFWKMGDGTIYNTASVTHSYAQPGSYNITVITDFGNCRDTLTKKVVVSGTFSVDFTASDTTNCQSPFAVSFSNTSANAAEWSWDFGDSSTSNAKEPSHTYITEGSYTVTLRAKNAAGCTSETLKSNYITIRKPLITFSNVPGGGCKPYSFTPSYAVDNIDTIATYRWEFGDGGESAARTPTHIYNDVGTYTLKLFTTTKGGCSDSLIFVNGIKTGVPAPVDFSVSPPVVCGKAPVSFTAIVDPSIQVFNWAFGDNGASVEKNPTHRYQDTGNYSVALSIVSNGCRSEIIKFHPVRVQGTIARFVANKICNDKKRFDFLNTSSSALTSEWNFGDASSSNSVNPTHSYSASGEYTVRLVTSSAGCTDTATMKVPIWLEPTRLTFSRDTLCKNDKALIAMVHPNASAVREYYWNPEVPTYPGFYRTLTTPIEWTFSRPGFYSFAGYTVDSFGCRDTVVRPNAIRIYGPQAYFDVAQKEGCLSNSVSFIDTSKTVDTNPLVGWTWNFGDGVVEDFTSSPFSHTYTNAGSYNVSLKITDRFGCTDSLTQQNFVTRVDSKADFSTVDSLTCSKSTVQFLNTSKGDIIEKLWSFGDGTTSSDYQPVHVYTDTGNYTVKLKISTLGNCIDSIQKTGYVRVKNPKAAFTASDTSISCPPLQINFFDSSYYAYNYEWSFDDGNISSLQNPVNVFLVPGNYRVRLKVTSAGSCEDSAFKTIRIGGPQGKLSYTPLEGCAPFKTNFKVSTLSATEFSWDYGDGVSVTTTDSLTSYTYTSGGSFLPTVLIKDRSGCLIPVTGKDTIHVDQFEAAFRADNKLFCDSGLVQFTDSLQTTSDRLSYQWNFGDGIFSTERSPRHFYNKAGNYPVSLVITSSLGCSRQVTYSNFITVSATPKPVIIATPDACALQNIVFKPELANPSTIATWQWTFGNNQTSSLQDPPQQTFSEFGSFSNSLNVINIDGCTGTAVKEVKIVPAPIVLLNADTTICKGDGVQLSASNLSSYTWQPASGLSCSSCSSPLASPTADTWYTVKGFRTSSACEVMDSVLIKVLQPYILKANSNVVLCTGEQGQLQASGAPNYMWSPAEGLSAPNIAQPVITIDRNIDYKVVGYDTLGCFTDSAFVAVRIFTYPSVQLGADATLATGNTYVFNPVISPDVTAYNWTPSTGLTCTTCPNPELTATINATYVLKVANAAGCEASDSLQIFVTCNNSNVFVPNTFSPNKDGMNDYFYPRGKGVYSVQNFIIFNRWGVKVFEKKNISVNREAEGWDGIYNGKLADSGVYTYFMEIRCNNNQLLKYSGNISLIQ
jgi:gliding motility-associated-like protein